MDYIAPGSATLNIENEDLRKDICAAKQKGNIINLGTNAVYPVSIYNVLHRYGY